MKSWFVRVMMLLIFLALVANLVVSAISGDTLIGEETTKMIAFFSLVAANVFIAGAGIYFTTKANQKHERESLKWSRRAFGVNMIATLVFGIAPYVFYEVTEGFSRGEAMLDVALILLLFGVSNATFGFAAYRDYVRSVSSRSDRGPRPRRRKSSSERSRTEDPAGRS